jgi:hypothetical protein
MGVINQLDDGFGIAIGGGSAPFVGLLDTYSGAAAAYSVRLLSNTYSGALVEVREDGGNNVKSFLPDSNNELSLDSLAVSDGQTLSAFVGSNNGFVRTWYDQSGNANNAIQTTVSLQSQIIVSGAITNVNSKPSSDFDGSGYYSISSPVTPVTTFSVAKVDAASSVNYMVYSSSLAKGYYLYGSVIGNNVGVFDGSIKNAFANDLNQHLNYFYYNGTNFQVSQDNGSETALTTGSNFSVNLIGRNNAGISLNAKMQELILYASDKSSDKAGIQTNQNDYFTIY